VRRPPRVDCRRLNCRAVRASFLVALFMRQQNLPHAVHGSTSSPRTVESAAFRAELDEASPRTVVSAAFRAELDEASPRTGTGHILLTECYCVRPKTSRSCAAHVFSSRTM
jgi:tRNA pseudouridine-54 N-methylase